MIIAVLGVESDRYRHNSIIGAIYEQVGRLSVGDGLMIDSVVDVDGTVVGEKSTRTHLSIIAKENGVRFATRKRGSSLSVTRTA